MNQIRFFVAGVPKPAGSKRSLHHKTTGKIITMDSSGKAGRDWRHDVKCAAFDEYRGAPLECPLRLLVVFRVSRPQSHFGARGLKPKAPKYPTVKPDCTKLLRSLEDALNGLLYRDDAQIVVQSVCKAYCNEENPHPGALVILQSLEP